MKKIMIVEDDPDVSNFLGDLLKAHEYEVHMFASGQKALGEIEKVLPDILIMDLMMPGMNGFEVCKAVRAKRSMHNLPMIAITGYDSIENRLKIFEAGIDDYLPKPFDVATLMQKITALI